MKDRMIGRIEFVTLERLRLGVDHAMSRELEWASPIEVERAEDYLRDAVVYRFRTEVAAQNLEHATVTHPASWWDAVKQAFYRWCSYDGGGHWPWFGEDFGPKKWPVKERMITIDVKALYPSIVMPDHQHHIKVFRRESL